MSPAVPRPVFVLNIHADYHCRHAGACCTAGWDIPIEPRAFAAVAEAVREGLMPIRGLERAEPADRLARAFVGEAAVTGGAEAILQKASSGDCVFFDRTGGRRCEIHRRLGHQALPVACQQFPRVARLDDDGARVTLSHFCPTAASMLFCDDVDRVAVVRDPPAYVGRDYDGFDARGTVPPFLRPGVVFDAEARAAWDQFVIDACNLDGWAPEQVIAHLGAAAKRVSQWVPAAGTLAECARAERSANNSRSWDSPNSRSCWPALFQAVADTVPDGLPTPVLPDDVERHDARWVAPVWAGFGRPLRRYLAARAFGAWTAYQADGLRTEIAVLEAAMAVVRVEATRQAATAGRLLDADLLREAFRASDLLTVHLSDQRRLAERLAATPAGSADRSFANGRRRRPRPTR